MGDGTDPGPGRADRVLDRRSALRWAVVALWLALTVASLGAFFNDEVLQAIAYDNLLDGHLSIQERPDHLWQITEDVRFDVRHPHVSDGRIVPNASPMLDFLALPAGWLLLLVDKLVPARVALLAAWAVLGHKTTRWGIDRVASWSRRGAGRPPDWDHPVAPRFGGGVPRWMLLAWLWTALAAWGAASLPPIDLEHWLPLVALGLTNALLFAATAGLLWLLVRRALPVEPAAGSAAGLDAGLDAGSDAGLHAGSDAGLDARSRFLADLAVVLFLLSPALFWAAGQKYHTTQALLAVLAALLYHEGTARAREGPTLAAAFVAGLALFSNEMGVALLAAVAVAHALTLSGRGGAAALAPWRWRDGRHVLAFGASALAGLVPWIVHDTLLGVAPWSRGAPGASPDPGAAADAVGDQYQFGGPAVLLGNLWDAHLDAGHFEGHPAAVLVIAPWVLAALAGLLLTRKTPGLRLAALTVVFTWLVVGPRLPTQGSGFDPRFLSGLWPLLALLAVFALRHWFPDAATARRLAARRTALVAGLGLAGVLAVLAWMASTHFLLGPPDGSQLTVAHRWVGRMVLLLVGLLGLAAALHRPLRPTLPVLLGLALVPALLWLLDAVLVHHRRLAGIDGAETVAFLTPLGHWLWDLAWDRLVPCEGRYVCTVR